MIAVICHGSSLSNPRDDDFTFVPAGLEVHFYSEENQVIHTGYGAYLAMNLDSLPEPVQKLKAGRRILNQTLSPHVPSIQAAHRQLIPDELQDQVVLEIAAGTRLCTDNTGSVCDSTTRQHHCQGLLSRYQGRQETLVLLICRGSEANPEHGVWTGDRRPPDYGQNRRAATLGTQAYATAAYSRELATLLIDLADLADREGMFVLYLRLASSLTGLRNRFDKEVQNSDRRHQTTLRTLWDPLNQHLQNASKWFSRFDRAGRDKRVEMLLDLSEQDRRIAAEISPSVRNTLAVGPIARDVALSVGNHSGLLSLLLHFLTESKPVRGRLRIGAVGSMQNPIPDLLEQAADEVSEFEASGHSDRLTKWIDLGPVERKALRELAWRSDLGSVGVASIAGTKRWLRELHEALDTFRASSRLPDIGAISLHWQIKFGADLTKWADLCKTERDLRRPYTEGATLIRRFRNGLKSKDKGVCTAMWNVLPAEGRVMLAQLSPGISRWLRSGDQLRAEARAAREKNGFVGLVAFFEEPGQEWRREVTLPADVEQVKAQAYRWLDEFDQNPLPDRYAIVRAMSDEKRRLLLMVSSGARIAYATSEKTRHDLMALARGGPLHELWSHWLSAKDWYAATGSPGQELDDPHLLDQIGEFAVNRIRIARRLNTEVVPALRQTTDSALADALRHYRQDEIDDICDISSSLGARIKRLRLASGGRADSGGSGHGNEGGDGYVTVELVEIVSSLTAPEVHAYAQSQTDASDSTDADHLMAALQDEFDLGQAHEAPIGEAEAADRPS